MKESESGSRVRPFATPWTLASMGFPRQDHWSDLSSHSLLQGISSTQGLNPGLLHCRQILYHPSHQGSPLRIYPWLNWCLLRKVFPLLWVLHPHTHLTTPSYRFHHSRKRPSNSFLSLFPSLLNANLQGSRMHLFSSLMNSQHLAQCLTFHKD